MAAITQGIETNPRNLTRFVVVRTTAFDRVSKTKSAVVFSTSNESDASFEVTKVYAGNPIDLVKLVSRPPFMETLAIYVLYRFDIRLAPNRLSSL